LVRVLSSMLQRPSLYSSTSPEPRNPGTPHSLLSPSPAPHQKEVFILVQNLLESFPPTTNLSAKTPGAKMSNLTRRMPQDSASGNLFDTRTKHRHNFCREGPKNQDWNVFTHLLGSMVLHCPERQRESYPKAEASLSTFKYCETCY
jgi:hypothetical protein